MHRVCARTLARPSLLAFENYGVMCEMADEDALERLTALIGIGIGSLPARDWEAVEASLGLTLPSDYKKLADNLPRGRFKDLVGLVLPDGDGQYRYGLDSLRRWRANGDGDFPYPLFPENGGLLPWGDTFRGQELFWLTGPGSADDWPVIWASKNYWSWYRYDGTMSQFLVELVTGRPVGVEAIADDDLADRAAFRRFDEPGWEPRTSRAESPEAPQNRSSALLATLLDSFAVRTGRRDWTAVEQSLGTPLPQDYKTVLDAIGAGILYDITLAGMDGSDATGVVDLLARQRDRIAAPLHPARYGLLPWGEASDGWIFAWKIRFVDPNMWATVAIDPQMSCVELPGISFSQFLISYAGTDDNAAPLIPGRPGYHGETTFQPLPSIDPSPGSSSPDPGLPRLGVIAVQHTGGARWAYVSGHLEGNGINVGDEVVLADGGVDVTTTTVRSVEKYSPPPITTIAVDAAVADLL